MSILSGLIVFHPRKSKNSVNFLRVKIFSFSLSAAKSELKRPFLFSCILPDINLVLDDIAVIKATFGIALIKLTLIASYTLTIAITAVKIV